MKHKGYEIAESKRTGGKAGKGHNKTATIQVHELLHQDGFLLKKQFRFFIGDFKSRYSAIQKAKLFIDNLIS